MSNKQIDKDFYKTIERAFNKTGSVSLLSIIDSQSKHRFKQNHALQKTSYSRKIKINGSV
ncbi:hypothetical protein C0W40_01255 [Photobacterium leiognathi subsp. mandapamensis]|nr:hypothetical protein CRG86_000725 [Photobacterium leiognathi]PSW46484.1 hypothetical protein C0W40_01255 [Photobacterium leiognathi subsp. mandapamensis]